MLTDSNDAIKCFDVEISGTRICQFDGEWIVATVLREQITTIKLDYQTNAKYPFFQYFLGFTLISLGLLGLLVAFLAIIGDGSIIRSHVPSGFSLPLIPTNLWIMVGVGLFLLSGIFRGRYFLSIETGNETRKIFFKRSANIDEIQHCIREAESKFGYEIDLSLLKETVKSE